MPPTSRHASASKRPRIPQHKARKARVINNPEMITRHLPRKNSYLTSKLLRGTPAPAPTDRPLTPAPQNTQMNAKLTIPTPNNTSDKRIFKTNSKY